MKYNVAVARMAVSGQHRFEIGDFLVEVVSVSHNALKEPIQDVLHYTVSQVPTDVARNYAVNIAQKHKADILFMVDDDSVPPSGWFETAFRFLSTHNGPAIIGCPYVSGGIGGIEHNVQVFEWQSPGNQKPQSFALKQIPREDAAKRTGIQSIANIGTHCIAYKMDAFDKIQKPYYAYTYNEDATKVLDTEEIRCHRAMYFAGVPIYVSWDHWSDHIKLQRLGKPWTVTREDVEVTYLKNMESILKHESNSKPSGSAGNVRQSRSRGKRKRAK